MYFTQEIVTLIPISINVKKIAEERAKAERDEIEVAQQMIPR